MLSPPKLLTSFPGWSKPNTAVSSNTLLLWARIIVANTNDGVPAMRAGSLAQNCVIEGVDAAGIGHDSFNEIGYGPHADVHREGVLVAKINGGLVAADGARRAVAVGVGGGG